MSRCQGNWATKLPLITSVLQSPIYLHKITHFFHLYVDWGDHQYVIKNLKQSIHFYSAIWAIEYHTPTRGYFTGLKSVLFKYGATLNMFDIYQRNAISTDWFSTWGRRQTANHKSFANGQRIDDCQGVSWHCNRGTATLDIQLRRPDDPESVFPSNVRRKQSIQSETACEDAGKHT